MQNKIFKILLYGLINFMLVLGLMSLTNFSSGGSIQDQLIPIAIIIVVTGLVNYMVIHKKIF